MRKLRVQAPTCHPSRYPNPNQMFRNQATITKPDVTCLFLLIRLHFPRRGSDAIVHVPTLHLWQMAHTDALVTIFLPCSSQEQLLSVNQQKERASENSKKIASIFTDGATSLAPQKKCVQQNLKQNKRGESVKGSSSS